MPQSNRDRGNYGSRPRRPKTYIPRPAHDEVTAELSIEERRKLRLEALAEVDDEIAKRTNNLHQEGEY
ncbi:MAG: hypothetical protein ABIH37_00180 [archaeon]